MKSKKIALIGLITFLAIILFLTAFFNLLWSGTGSDPTRSPILPFTNNIDELKDYATLYIALLSFGGTMFTGLVVFLVFNDWKDQHNKTVIAEEAKALLLAINDDIEALVKVSSKIRNDRNNQTVKQFLNEEFLDKLNNFGNRNILVASKALILYELCEDQDLFKIREKYHDFLANLNEEILKHIKINSQTTEITNMLNKEIPKFIKLNKEYKVIVKKYILAQ